MTKKTTILKWAMVLYIAVAVFMVGIVHATFCYDEDTQYGTYSAARSYVSGDRYGGEIHDPFFRSSGWNTTLFSFGYIYIEYYWYGDEYTLKEGLKYDSQNPYYVMDEQSYYGDFGQATCMTRAGRYYLGTYYPADTNWTIAGIPFNP